MSIAINTNFLKKFQFPIVTCIRLLSSAKNYQLAFVTILMMMVSMGTNAQNVNQLFKEGKALYEAKNYDQDSATNAIMTSKDVKNNFYETYYKFFAGN